jgi:hypothetical protein
MKHVMNAVVAAVLSLSMFGCGPSSLEAEESPPGEPLGESQAAVHQKPAECTMHRQTACIVNTSKAERTLVISYPNTVFCSVRLHATEPWVFAEGWTKLLKDLDIRMTGSFVPLTVHPTIQPQDEETVDFGLGSELLYMTKVTVKTKSGRSLNEIIAKTIGGDLVAVPQYCPGRPL